MVVRRDQMTRSAGRQVLFGVTEVAVVCILAALALQSAGPRRYVLLCCRARVRLFWLHVPSACRPSLAVRSHRTRVAWVQRREAGTMRAVQS